MQRFLRGLLVVVTAMALPAMAFGDNQDVANQIAKKLRSSGQLHDYKVGVKFQNGTAWLSGQVGSPQQMNTALKLVFQTPGVTRVVNQLAVGEAAPAAPQKGGTNVPLGQAVPPAMKPAIQIGRTANKPEARNRQVPKQPPPAIRKMTRRPLFQFGKGAKKPASPTPAAMKPAQGAWAPEKMSPAKRLQMVLTGVTRKTEVTAPSDSLATGQVQQVPSTFTQAPARQAVATVSQPFRQPAARVMSQRPVPAAYAQPVAAQQAMHPGAPIPAYVQGVGGGVTPARYDQPHLPNHAWPSYAAYPNYAGLTYPRQYSPTAWPYIGPFYPYPQVPLGWRKVTLEWDDGWWMLDFHDH